METELKEWTVVCKLTPEQVRAFRSLCALEGVGLGERVAKLVLQALERDKWADSFAAGVVEMHTT